MQVLKLYVKTARVNPSYLRIDFSAVDTVGIMVKLAALHRTRYVVVGTWIHDHELKRLNIWEKPVYLGC